MQQRVTSLLKRNIHAGRSLGLGVLRIARRILAHLFGLGVNFVLGAMVVAFVSATVLYIFASSTIDESKAYRHLIPLVGTSPEKSCGGQDNAIPTMTHPLQSDQAHRRLHEPFKTTGNSVYDCAIQHHVNQSVNYDLAFLEFNDAGHLIAPAQWDALKTHLKAQKNVNVLLFVHGWRNDAHIGSEDVERFHTLLSLSANYANQRGNVAGNSPSKTIGIFIGWQGRMIDEKSDFNDPDRESWHAQALNRLAIPTILWRKPRSDAIAKSIGRQILDIEQLVKGEENDRHENKLTVLGHSLGGNIVIQGLSDTLVERISASQSADQIRGVGDLVVLINPASEARHFFDVQRAAHSIKAPPPGSPVVVSVTAAKYFNEITDDSKAWDTAVGKFLPIAHRVFNWNTGQPEDIQSIGNYLPFKLSQGTSDPTMAFDLRGVSHEIEFDDPPGKSTTYAFTGAHAPAQHPQCPVENKSTFMDWQKAAMVATHTTGWDTEYKVYACKKHSNDPCPKIQTQSWLTLPKPDADVKPSTKHTASVSGEPCSNEERIRINIRHGATRHQCLDTKKDNSMCRNAARDAGVDIASDQRVQIPTIGPAWSPVWNAAVHSNVIDEHGGYLSHTLWCVLSRFALDRPAPNGGKVKNQSKSNNSHS